jgi:hypothetical protein
MADDVEVPKLGKVPKRILIPIVVAGGGFVAWRYYQARGVTDAGDGGFDTGFEDEGVLPGVAGAVRPDNDYGEGNPVPSTDDFGFRGHTNAEWSQYATTQLSQSDRWSYSDIISALGNYLDRQPLSDLQQEIVRSAIAAAGPPPVDYYNIIPGGNTDLTIAPSGVTATATATSISVSFTPVAGAKSYNVYRSNTTNTTTVPHGTANSSPVALTGLTPNTSYSIRVAAVSSSGKVGPMSTAITVKTAAVNVARPYKPTVSNITNTSAVLTTKPVPFATSYQWYVQSILRGTTDGPTWTATRMKSRTRYRAQVRADTTTGAPSKLSDSAYFTTK